MNAPKTYAEWSKLMAIFKEQKSNDEECLAAMEKGGIEWTAGIAEKMTQQAYAVIESRLQAAAQSFNAELNRAGGQEASIVKALTNVRTRFAMLQRFCQLPVFPEKVRSTLSDVLNRYIDDTQQSLVASAREDRSGKLAHLVKSNSLTNYTQSYTPARNIGSSNDSSGYGNGQSSKRRRVLF
ncbi:hypothetical protein B1748_31365 [Paenibacillus sp. MY03]|uniref:hypothetical protein n=1 Tax=Paenibacillus sp. MY03 TaxID=302980 RepID=UPI000B3C2902|nr:hypothetical protein [Paenibacillus sp. MY03]OUS69482.1 hypothetical protein B1748_31365 [Paenibacillus sp. MY03]